MNVRLIVALALATIVSMSLVPQSASAEQLALFELMDCPGATDSSTPPCYTFAVMDASGAPSIQVPGYGGRPRWSPDGRSIVGTGYDAQGNADIYASPLVGGPGVNVSNHPASDRTPAWSPDGTRIAFASNRNGATGLFVVNADGSGVAPIVTGTGEAWAPSWSRDSTRVAFNCADSAESPVDICAIDVDGTDFARLTSDPANDFDPAWSPDGNSILFVSERFSPDSPELILIDASGSGEPVRLIPGTTASSPSWSADGSRIAFDAVYFSIENGGQPVWYVYVANANGTDAHFVAAGHSPAWRPGSTVVTNPPVASFTFTCEGVTCTFDASGSSDTDGTVSAYGWPFGDGTNSGAVVTHTFVAGSIYEIRLLVMDDQGALGATTRTVDLNEAPVARFTSSCSGLTCTFDGSASTDPDGAVWYYSWQYGDGREGTSARPTHTYPADGTYQVTLRAYDEPWEYGTYTATVTVANVAPVASFTFACSVLTCTFDASGSSDDGPIATYAWAFGDRETAVGNTSTHRYGASGSYDVTLTVTDSAGARDAVTQSVTVREPEVHVGDLDGQTKSVGSTWTATVTVRLHNNEHFAGGGATVSGSWSSGQTATCITDASGSCSMSLPSIPKNTSGITYTVTALTSGASVYRPALNHDPESDSTGSSITIKRP